MGKALYRKYRSKKLSEIIGQEHITTTLEQALKQGKISHAYLFTGPRGIGKTSIARILAHEINNIPYEDDSMHLDIIEIDAASNRRIDEIRDLRDKVHVAPSSAKYKVYIIDEVHMLTKEAFNALLKTLEEPPAHAIFILATTDAHKLPDTIISRTQRYTFRPVSQEKVVAHLRTIADAENITISGDALQLLAEHGEGSFRDSISMLDQASSGGKAVELEDVQAMLGIAPKQAIEALAASLDEGAASATIMQQVEALYLQGFQAASIAKQLGEVLRAKLLSSKGDAIREQLELLAALIEVPVAYNPERFLEITLLSLTAVAAPARALAPPTAAEVPQSAVPAPPKAAANVTAQAPKPVTKPVEQPQATPEPVEATPVTPEKTPEIAAKVSSDAVFNDALWPQILDSLKQKYNTLYGVVRMAQPIFLEDDKLQLNFTFLFHQKRINEATNRQILMDIVHELTGQNVTIECLFSKEKVVIAPIEVATSTPQATSATPAAPQKDTINAISNIFGGGELLES